MTLIDTSSLVHLLRRKGNLVVKKRVASILQSGEAAICEMVAIELWMGVGSRQDERDVEEFCSLIRFLPITEAVWTRARQLARLCRSDGRPVPCSDVVIAACAFVHGVALDYEDQHFSVLERHRTPSTTRPGRD